MGGKNVSSYQKGINNLLDHREDFEMLISEYLLSVNSKYRSNMFPTPQIAKVLLGKLKLKKTKFAIIHKIVRIILKDWETHGWCSYVTTTKSGRNRKNKVVYQFSPKNFQFLKGKFISGSISEIENDPSEANDNQAPVREAMKTREIIFEDWTYEIQDLLNKVDEKEGN